jgi:hypothetical protein
MTQVNLQDRFITIIKNHTDIPEKFLIATSYSLVAQTVGRFVFLEELPYYRPNIFVILAGAPRVPRRGELFKLHGVTFRESVRQYHGLNGCEEKASLDIQAHMLDGGSPQGIADAINEFREKKNITSYAIKSNEFGRKLDQIFNDIGYMRGMDSLLCQLWSGESYLESFSTRGEDKRPRYIPEGMYFNLLGGMQKANNYIHDKKISETGLGRRLSIWNVEGADTIGNYKPFFGRKPIEMNQELTSLGKDIGDAMFAYQSGVYLKIDDDFNREFSKKEEELTRYAKENDTSPYFLFLQGQIDQILKFSMLRCIADGRTTLTLSDYNQAFIHAVMSTKDLKEMFDDMLLTKEKKTQETRRKAFLRCLKRRYNKSQSERYLRGGYGMTRDDIRAIAFNMLKETPAPIKQKEDWYELL